MKGEINEHCTHLKFSSKVRQDKQDLRQNTNCHQQLYSPGKKLLQFFFEASATILMLAFTQKSEPLYIQTLMYLCLFPKDSTIILGSNSTVKLSLQLDPTKQLHYHS